MQPNYYITTPIYYVNDKPHIGHAYTSLACDVLARFKRLDGFNVKFLTGTDEHGQKVEKSARDKNIDPQSFTDQVSESFRELTKIMNFSQDDFIRTTEARHKKSAQAFWEILEKNGFIYQDKYAGWYSVRDEAFYAEDELIDGKAPTGAEVEWHEEESYFFKLSAFQDKLLQYYQDHPEFLAPKSRANEVISFVRGGKEYKEGALKDLSISRTSFSWGVKVPNDDKHIMYVWLDALTNYLSALGFPDIENDDYKNFWPAYLHMVGKDIIRFHAVYWPAFLMAANLPVPKRIFAHGWWTNEGEKISKSLGNVIDPIALVEEFGLDQIRFFLMRQVPFGNDGNYSREELIRRCNSDLANNFGNLSQRSLAMIAKNCDAVVPNKNQFATDEHALLNHAYNLINNLRQHIDKQDFSSYLDDVMQLATKANEFIDEKAPWTLKKTDPDAMAHILYILAELIRVIAIYLSPFMPESCAKILDQLAIDNNSRSFDHVNAPLESGTPLPTPQGVFPRITLEQ